MYTKHGHQIRGTPVEGKKPDQVARCGGPGFCSACSIQAIFALSPTLDEVLAEGRKETKMEVFGLDEANARQLKARLIVMSYVNERREKTDNIPLLTIEDIYVVWFVKVLKNWKALLSTNVADGMYYELTYNGDNLETYLDAYKKFDNVSVPD